MRISIQDSLLPGTDLVERMRTAAAIGFDSIEVRSSEALSSPDILRRAVRELPLPVGSIVTNPQQDPVVEEREVRETRLAAWDGLIRAAADLGARGIIMVPIRRPHRLPDLSPLYTSAELEMALLYRVLEDLVPKAERAGVALWIEPLNFYEAMLVPNIAKAVEICRHLDTPGLQLMADTFHMNIMERDPLASLQEAAPYLGHVHLSDSNRQMPGLGHIDFARIFAALEAIGFDGDAAIEAIPPADAEAGAQQSLACLRRALGQAGI